MGARSTESCHPASSSDRVPWRSRAIAFIPQGTLNEDPNYWRDRRPHPRCRRRVRPRHSCRGADARAADGAELTDVYIVKEAIPDGTTGESVEEFVRLDSVPERNLAEGAITSSEDLEKLAGLVTDAEILPGEQLLSARFVDPAELAAQGNVATPSGMQLIIVSRFQRIALSADRCGLVITLGWSAR